MFLPYRVRLLLSALPVLDASGERETAWFPALRERDLILDRQPCACGSAQASGLVVSAFS
jgi:hypothetical protein